MRLLLGCLLIMGLSFSTAGQNFQHSLPERSLRAADTNALFLSIHNANFLKNNEYYNEYVDGYTKLGFFLKPRLTYVLSEKTRLSAGVHLLKYAGSDHFHQIKPVFSLNHQLSPHLNLVMGTLNNAQHHHLIDPIYHFENYLDKHIENGVQFLMDHPAIRADVWINWQRFILQGSDLREQFESGVSTDIPLWGRNKDFSVGVPFQLLIQHKGGQIDQSGKPISTLYNMATGLSFKLKTGSGWIRSVSLNNHLVLYRDASPQKRQPYDQGHAIYSSLNLNRKNLSLELAYWNAYQYLSFSGNPIFQAYSVKRSSVPDTQRELFAGRLKYTRQYRDVQLLVNLDSYFDPHNHKFDFGFGLYLLLNTELFLTRSSPSSKSQ